MLIKHELVIPHANRPHDFEEGIFTRTQGILKKKPWDYECTALIPHIETPELLDCCISLIRLQTKAPYIMVIDTGSSWETVQKLESMRAEDLEIHYLRSHGQPHTSDTVCAALDLGFSMCRTDKMFTTHVDCFLRRRDFIEDLLNLCNNRDPAVGYKMSPRDWVSNEWETCISHTASMFDMPTMYEIGATWTLARAHHAYGYDRSKGSWPDTETAFNQVLKDHGIAPLFIGEETNYERFVDKNLDHCRSYPGSKVLGFDEYFKEASNWMGRAIAEAQQRIVEWMSESYLA